MNDSSSTSLLVERLRALASSLTPGDRLPSSRTLVREHGVGPGTVSTAIARLVAEGVLVTEAGRGTFVAARRPRRGLDVGWQTVALGEPRVDAREVANLLRPPPEGTTLLSTGYPSTDLHPTAALAGAAGRAARRPGGWWLPPTAGLHELRELLGAPVGADPADVLVVGGGQAGLSAAMRALSSPGAPVLVEVPTYLGALAAARGAGLRPVPVPTDAAGLRAELLAEAFARSGARLLYLQPTYANPTGSVLQAERRVAVLDAARQAGAFVIEDDWARYLHLDGPEPPPLLRDDTDGRVVHLSSLTKVVAPGLRVGAVVAHGPAAARLATVRMIDDFFVARPLQETAVGLLGSPSWPRHQARLRAALRSRRDALVAAVTSHLVPHGVTLSQVPHGGLHLWLQLPDGTDDVAFAARAAQRGVQVSAGRPYFVAEPPTPHLRVSYAGLQEQAFDEPVRRLGELLATEQGADSPSPLRHQDR